MGFDEEDLLGKGCRQPTAGLEVGVEQGADDMGHAPKEHGNW